MTIVPRETIEAERRAWAHAAADHRYAPKRVREHAQMMCDVIDELLTYRELAANPPLIYDESRQSLAQPSPLTFVHSIASGSSQDEETTIG